MQQLKTRVFQRWQKKSGITDAALLIALAEMQAGLIDADLGGGVVKKRVALAGPTSRPQSWKPSRSWRAGC
jgi:hypothetical protein